MLSRGDCSLQGKKAAALCGAGGRQLTAFADADGRRAFHKKKESHKRYRQIKSDRPEGDPKREVNLTSCEVIPYEL